MTLLNKVVIFFATKRRHLWYLLAAGMCYISWTCALL